MSLAQVEDILGVPPGDYATESVRYPLLEPVWSTGARQNFAPPIPPAAPIAVDPSQEQAIEWVVVSTPRGWSSNDCEIIVRFDVDGSVESTHYTPAVAVTETFYDKVRRWLGL